MDKKDLPCASCGQMMWRGSTSAPDGKARCQPCRRTNGSAARKAASKAYRSTPTPCLRCEQMFIPTKTSQKYCSRKCSRESARGFGECPGCGKVLGCYRSAHCQSCRRRLETGWGGGKEVALYVRPAAKRASKAARLARTWYAGTCIICDASFADTYRRRTCSEQCGALLDAELRREAKDRRRARMRNAYVSPVNRRQVFERDAWTCQLCHEPVERDKVVPHPKAPTIDHVIPLARGGTHEMANTQCAHFLCNATKSDRVDWAPVLMA